MFRLFKMFKAGAPVKVARISAAQTVHRRSQAQDLAVALDVVVGNSDVDWQNWDDAVSWQNQQGPVLVDPFGSERRP